MASIPVPTHGRSRRGSLFKERLLLPSPPVAFIGDSIVAKFAEEGKDVWERCYADMGSSNMGIVGDSTQMLIEKLERDLLPLQETSTVVLMIGATDLRHRVKGPVVFDQIRKIIMLLQSCCRPGVKIIVLGILPRGDSNVELNPVILEINESLESIENGFTVRFVRLAKKFYDKEKGTILADLFSSDKINLSPKGYEVLSEAINPVLKECLQE